jgi:hypothetical protein
VRAQVSLSVGRSELSERPPTAPRGRTESLLLCSANGASKGHSCISSRGCGPDAGRLRNAVTNRQKCRTYCVRQHFSLASDGESGVLRRSVTWANASTIFLICVPARSTTRP